MSIEFLRKVKCDRCNKKCSSDTEPIYHYAELKLTHFDNRWENDHRETRLELCGSCIEKLAEWLSTGVKE